MIYAPYLPNLGTKGIERADTSHMVLLSSSVKPFPAQVDAYVDYLLGDVATKRLI